MMLRKRAWDMMRDEYPTVQEDASPAEAIRVMREAMVEAPDSQVVVVKTKGGRLKGTINLWQLFKAVKQSVLKDENLTLDGEVDWDQQFANACLICTQLRLDEYIIPNPPLLKPNDPILVVLDVFLKSRRDWALVVEAEKVMGVVYVTDVYRDMTRDMVQIFKSSRPRCRAAFKDDEPMQLDDDILGFLRGEQFSSGCCLRLSGDFKERSRLTYMQRVVKGASVLHIGCVDHTPEKVRRKLARGVWLHKLLMDSAELCAGVDINEPGVKYLSEDMGLPHIHCGDILRDTIPGVNDRQWDFVVLGELLEHTDNPVDFLATLRSRPGLERAACIVTVPNAFYYKNFKKALKQYEDINSDHRYWFTPYTPAKVLTRAGYAVDDLQLTQDRAFKFFPPIPWFILSRYPLLRSKVVALASPIPGRE